MRPGKPTGHIIHLPVDNVAARRAQGCRAAPVSRLLKKSPAKPGIFQQTTIFRSLRYAQTPGSKPRKRF
jgi:hypothetical protein